MADLSTTRYQTDFFCPEKKGRIREGTKILALVPCKIRTKENLRICSLIIPSSHWDLNNLDRNSHKERKY